MSSGEVARRDAHDDDRMAVDAVRLSHDSRIAGESPLPIAVSDDGHERRADLVVFACQQAARDRNDTHRLVEGTGDEGTRRPPGVLQWAGLKGERTEPAHTIEDLSLIGKRADSRV